MGKREVLGMEEYLESSSFIDWKHPEILERAESLANSSQDKLEIAKSCFDFVRDEIKHSYDFRLDPVTCRASDTLIHGTGYCYAKSHLLAALLRANAIPAGLCYQRLLYDKESGRFCLHGLNAVFLEEFGWYRIDPRGNNHEVTTEFSPPLEQLAFRIQVEGEVDFQEKYANPLPAVVEVLTSLKSYIEVAENLPDMVPVMRKRGRRD